MDVEWVFCTIHHHAPITAGQSSFIFFGQHSILAGFVFHHSTSFGRSILELTYSDIPIRTRTLLSKLYAR